MEKKMATYIVTVTRVTDDGEEEIFSMDFDYNENRPIRECCARALETSYYGCSDED